jgi:hypothetical protein
MSGYDANDSIYEDDTQLLSFGDHLSDGSDISDVEESLNTTAYIKNTRRFQSPIGDLKLQKYASEPSITSPLPQTAPLASSHAPKSLKSVIRPKIALPSKLALEILPDRAQKNISPQAFECLPDFETETDSQIIIPPEPSFEESSPTKRERKSRSHSIKLSSVPHFLHHHPNKPERCQVFVSAYMPLPGVSMSFDVLSNHYTPKKALQMILRRALDHFEHCLEEDRFKNLPHHYECDLKKNVPTSRIMRKELIERARLFYDPYGFESSRSFGLKIASTALAAFFAIEPKDIK